MTDIPALLAGWEEARNNLGRKGSLRTIELRTAGQKVADALRELEELAKPLARLPLPVTSDERVDWLTYQQRLKDVLASSVGVGAVATEDGKA